MWYSDDKLSEARANSWWMSTLNTNRLLRLLLKEMHLFCLQSPCRKTHIETKCRWLAEHSNLSTSYAIYLADTPDLSRHWNLAQMVLCSRRVVCHYAYKYTKKSHLLWSKAADKLIKLWDASTGQIIRTFSGHRQGISDVAWSNDSEYLASASDDKTVMIWSLELVRRSCHGYTVLIAWLHEGFCSKDTSWPHKFCILR